MRAVKILGLLLVVMLVPVGLLAIGVILLLRFETNRQEFADFAELQASGLIDQGWLPDYFPRSATDIRVTTYIDDSRVMATFKYSSHDVAEIAKVCRLLTGPEADVIFGCPPHPWIPSRITFSTDGRAVYEGNFNSTDPPIRIPLEDRMD